MEDDLKTAWQQHVFAVLFGLFLDAIAAYALAYLITDKPNDYFWLYAAIIILAPLPLALWSLAKRWIFFHLSGKEALTRAFLKELHQHRFPPTNGEFEIDRYLFDVVTDKAAADEARIAASSLSGQILSARAVGGFSSGIMVTMAAQNAMQRFRSRDAYEA